MTEKEFERAEELHDELRAIDGVLELLYADYAQCPISSISDFRLKNETDYSGYTLSNGMVAVIKEALQSYRNKLAKEFEEL